MKPKKTKMLMSLFLPDFIKKESHKKKELEKTGLSFFAKSLRDFKEDSRPKVSLSKLETLLTDLERNLEIKHFYENPKRNKLLSFLGFLFPFLRKRDSYKAVLK